LYRVSFATFPASRPRPPARDAFSRELVREHRVDAGNLSCPYSSVEGDKRAEDIPSMPARND
jgi:porphobilinogen synthase